MYKNLQAFTKAASFFYLLVLLYMYKYKSLSRSYTDMSANKRPDLA